MKRLVSVVITTYKRPIEVLKRAVESVVNQTYPDIEVIVVNDYPEDKELAGRIKQMLEGYSKCKIEYMEPPHNSGACAARNLGLANARGEFISFLDDDDYWLEKKLEVQISGFQNMNIGVVYTPYYLQYKNRKELVESEKKDGQLTETLLYRNSMCIFPLMRTELVRQVGGFDTELTASQEHDLLLRLSMKCEFKYIPIPIAVYDVSDESISMNISKKIKAFEHFQEKHRCLYEQYPDAYYCQLIRMVNNMNNAGHFSYALSLWKKAIKLKKYSPQNFVQPVKGFIKFILGRKAFH